MEPEELGTASGYARRPDDAMELLFAAGGAPGNTYPQEMVNRLVD